MADVKSEVERLLGSVVERGSPNRVDAAEVRDWVAGLVTDYAAERANGSGSDSSRPMWDLISADYASDRDALFVAVVITNESASFAAGRGRSDEVRLVGDTDFPDDPLSLMDDLQARFAVFAGPVRVTRSELDAWLA